MTRDGENIWQVRRGYFALSRLRQRARETIAQRWMIVLVGGDDGEQLQRGSTGDGGGAATSAKRRAWESSKHQQLGTAPRDLGFFCSLFLPPKLYDVFSSVRFLDRALHFSVFF